jgi:protein-tyrosine phosphatase
MGFFKKWKFKPEEPKVDPVDLSAVLVDMHSHFIPGIDDGASTMEDSLQLIAAMQELGYKKVITTPHIYRDLYPNTAETVLAGLVRVKDAVAKKGWSIRVEAAAEYYLDDQFEQWIEERRLLTLGRDYVLFEISFAEEPMNLKRALFNMKLQGYRPVLAHPERYEYWNGKFSMYRDLHEQDVLLQLNINSLTGHYGQGVKRISERMIDEGLVSFLGSDCHHTGHLQLMQQARTNPKLSALLEGGKLRNQELV